MLNGDGEVSRLMAVCARCVCDERAAVRRASVGLLQRLLTGTAPDGLPIAPSANDLGVSIQEELKGDSVMVILYSFTGQRGMVSRVQHFTISLKSGLAWTARRRTGER